MKPPLTPCVTIDDMQIDFGKHKSHDKELQEVAYFMTVQRTNIAVVLGTASLIKGEYLTHED